MKTDSPKTLITMIGWFVSACLAISSGQTNLASQYVLETNDKFEIVWNVSDLGMGYNNRRPNIIGAPSRIIILGGKNDAVLKTGNLFGLDSMTGNVVWTVSGASLGEIISNDETLYFGTYGTATIEAYSVENGKILWATLLPWAHSVSDIYFAENKIFVHTNDAEFYILNEQGDIIDSFSEIHSIFLETNGVLYMEDVHAIKAVNLSSKKELWRLDLGTDYTYAPIFDDGTIFLITADDPATIYSIDQDTGKVNWKTSQGVLSNLYVTEEMIYFIDRYSCLAILDKYSGNEVANVKILPPLALNLPDGSYFVSGDPTNNILALYFDDNTQIMGLKIKEP